MLLYFLIAAVLWILSAVFSIFPSVSALPFGLDSLIETGVGYVYALAASFPFLQVVIQLALAAIGIKLALFTWHFIEKIRAWIH